MATWYVIEGGSGDGTLPGTPSGSLSDLAGSISASDTINVAGNIHDSARFSVSVNNVTVQQWDGQAQGVIWGSILKDSASDWTDNADGSYYCTITEGESDLGPSGDKIASVTYDWAGNVDSLGRNRGHLDEAASQAACAATNGTWFFDASTNRVYVNPWTGGGVNDSDAAPTDGDAEAALYDIVLEGSGIEGTSVSGMTVRGLHFKLFSSANDSGDGYAVRLFSPADCTISDCKAWDCGLHSFGTVSAAQTGNRIVDCVAYGGRNGNSFVFFSGSGSGDNGCEFVRLTAHGYGLMRPDGVGVTSQESAGQSSGPSQAYFTHGGTSGGSGDGVQSLIGRECVAVGYDDFPGFTFFAGTGDWDMSDPTDRYDPTQYGVQFYDSSGTKLGEAISGGATDGRYTALVRCRFDCDNFDSGESDHRGIFLSRNDEWLLLQDTVLYVAPTAGSFTTCAVYNNGGELTIDGGAILANNTPATSIDKLIRLSTSGSGSFAMRGTVLDASAAGMEVFLLQGTGVGTFLSTRVTLVSNWYNSIGDVSNNTALDTQAELEALETGSTRFNDRTGLTFPPAEHPEPTAPVLGHRINLAGREGRTGIDGLPYEGRYGPWSPSRVRGRRTADRGWGVR